MSNERCLDGRYLVLNGGSSSIKFALLDMPEGDQTASGLAERLGTSEAVLTLLINGQRKTRALDFATHAQALSAIITELGALPEGLSRLAGIGHRVVHGGEFFKSPALIDDPTLETIERCARLAPLHNPANALVIRATRTLFPQVPQVAVFDTAFHQSMPEHAFLYAIPHHYYTEHGVRRYGAHGTSHQYVALKTAELLGKPLEETCLLTAHLGNGCSACAIANGKSVDTSMGLTPLEGLMMGTRSGDVDPNLFSYLHSNEGSDIEQIADMLNRKSGLLGVSGVSNDLRSVSQAAEAGNQRAQIAIDLFCYRLAKGLMALCAGLDRIDALVFTGGIGENASQVRQMTLGHLKLLGPELDPTRNTRHGKDSNGLITTDTSRLRALVVPTNEEWMIGRSTALRIGASLSETR